MVPREYNHRPAGPITVNVRISEPMSDALISSKAPAAVSDRVREAMAVTLRGCEELLPQAEWLKKLLRSEATGTALAHQTGAGPDGA